MLGLIAIPARDANSPLEGADSTLGGQPQRSQILSRPKCSNRRSWARLASGSPKAGETDLTPSERLFVQVGPRVRIHFPPAGSLVRTRLPLGPKIERDVAGSSIRSATESDYRVQPLPARRRPKQSPDRPIGRLPRIWRSSSAPAPVRRSGWRSRPAPGYRGLPSVRHRAADSGRPCRLFRLPIVSRNRLSFCEHDRRLLQALHLPMHQRLCCGANSPVNGLGQPDHQISQHRARRLGRCRRDRRCRLA